MAPSRSRPAVFGAVLAALIAAPLRAGSIQAPSPPLSDEAARRSLRAWCQKNFPSQCGALEGLLNDQLTLAGDLKACAARSCAYGKLFALDGRVVALNEQAAAVMTTVGTGTDSCSEIADHEDGFLRMQARLRASLAAAWKKFLEAPTAAPSADAKAAVAAAEALCAANPGGSLCSLSETVALESQELEAIGAACVKTPCPWREGKRLLADYLLLKNNLVKLTCLSADPAAKTTPAELGALDSAVILSSKIIALTLKGVTDGLDRADKTEDDLDRRIAAGMVAAQSGDKSPTPAEVSAMEDALNGVGGNLGSKSLMVDEMNQMLSGYVNSAGKTAAEQISAPLRDRVNAENDRYVALRARLRALRVAAGISFPTNHDEGPVERDPASTPAAKASAPSAAGTPARRTLDKTAVPSSPAGSVPAPPILANGVTAAQKLRMLVDSDPAVQAGVRADILRRAGLTRTVGDPGRRAALVYEQGSPEACAIVAQQEVLRAYGRIPATDPLKQQQELRAEAAEAGLFDSGTPSALSGALLEKHRLPTRVVNRGTIEQLNAAVLTGDFVIVGVDARPLWAPDHPAGYYAKSPALSHSVLVTGAEVSKTDGSILGYYVNDSGEPPGRETYFAPAVMFLQAWSGGSGSFVQVLK